MLNIVLIITLGRNSAATLHSLSSQLVCFLHFGNRTRMGECWKRNRSTCYTPKLLCIHIPSSAQDSPLMKDLKRGQKGYFYSIMRIYDSKAPREMLYHRYAINLQRQNVLGECQPMQLLASAAWRNWRAMEKSQGLEGITRRGLWAMKVHQTHSQSTGWFIDRVHTAFSQEALPVSAGAMGTTGRKMMWVCCYLCYIHPLCSLSLDPVHRNDTNMHTDSCKINDLRTMFHSHSCF
nr:PREDICTED: protein FAM216B isoform X1 [Anolis carolinensis]|eukprot:XP_016847738.1 PREDICTED: protein FAM216B isoform X1 [Anolis carolinensis]